MVYEEWAIEKSTVKKIITRIENHKNPLIREAKNYDEHRNHRTKKPWKVLLQKEEDPDWMYYIRGLW